MSEAARCQSCWAPLAEDQRYCLNCGERQGEPRIDFRRYEAPTPQPQETAPPLPVEEKPSRDYTPLAAAGGIAVLGVMLLIGVLIGKGDSGAPAPAPAPVVVQGGEADTGKTASDEGGVGAVEGGAKQAKSKAGGKGGAVKGGSTNTGNAPVASDEELQQLREQSPQEYSENSAKLPDEIATGGAPPAGRRQRAWRRQQGDGDRMSDDLQQRREQLSKQLAELQWDLGGVTYEMAIRDQPSKSPQTARWNSGGSPATSAARAPTIPPAPRAT